MERDSFGREIPDDFRRDSFGRLTLKDIKRNFWGKIIVTGIDIPKGMRIDNSGRVVPVTKRGD